MYKKIFRHFSIIIYCQLNLVITVQAQSKDGFYTYKNEVGTNVTSILGNMLSLIPPSDRTPYGFSYARHMANYTLRTSFDVFYNTKTSIDFDGTSIFQRELTDAAYTGRIGLERHYSVSPKIKFHYGLDALVAYTSSVSTSNNNFINSEIEYYGGGGPALRFIYKINNRISLLTEGGLYGTYGNRNVYTKLNGATIVEDKSSLYNFRLNVPTSLYVYIHF